VSLLLPSRCGSRLFRGAASARGNRHPGARAIGPQPLANAVGLSPDGSLVVTGDFEARPDRREVPSGTERWKVRVKPRREQRRIDGVFFRRMGSLIVTTGTEAQTTRGVGRGRPTVGGGARRSASARGVAFHPRTERMLAVAGRHHPLWWL